MEGKGSRGASGLHAGESLGLRGTSCFSVPQCFHPQSSKVRGICGPHVGSDVCSALSKHSSRSQEESGSRCGHSSGVAPRLGVEGPCRQVQGLEQDGQRGSGVATGLNSD